MKNLHFLWQMVQQNYLGENTNSKNPLWDGTVPKGERTSVENLMAIEKSFNLKKQKLTKESIKIFGLTQKLGKTFIVIILNREVQLYVPRNESYPIPLKNWWSTYVDLEIAQGSGFMTIWMSKRTEICQIRGRVSQDLRCWVKLLWEGIRRHHVQIIHGLTRWQEFGKAKHAYGKPMFQNNKSRSVWRTIHLFWYCRRKTEFCVVLQLGTRTVPMKKIWKKKLLPNFLISEVKLAHAVLLATLRVCGTTSFE